MAKMQPSQGRPHQELTDLQRLELAHAQHDEGALEDIENSNALTTDQSEFSCKYMLRVLGTATGIGLGVNAAYFGFSCPAAVLVYINQDIGPSESASLFPVIWTACAAISIILFGRFSDKFGRRWGMIGASLIGLIGGIIACHAMDMNTLVVANVFLGLSGGVHTCYGLTMGEVVPNRYKIASMSFVTLPCIVSVGFGAYIALKLINDGPGWRWIYYIYLILMGVATIFQYLFYNPPTFQQLHGGKRTVWQEVKRIDFVGTFLLTTGVMMFLLGISWGGQPAPWSSAKILSLIIVGIVCLVAFVFWEIYARIPNPVVPMYFFKDVRGFSCLAVIASVSGSAYVGPTIIWPSQVANIYGVGATDWKENAWLSCTVAFGIIGGIWLWGPLIGLLKRVKYQLVVMSCLVCAFSGALASTNRDNKVQSAIFSFFATFPDGIMELTPLGLVQMSANDADLGTVFGILLLFRTAWGSIFTAIYLAILQNKLPQYITAFVPSAAIAAGLPKSSLSDLVAAAALGTESAIAGVPGMTPTIQSQVMDALVKARVKSYSYVYYAMIAVNLAGVLAAFYLRDYDHLFTTHVPRQIYAKGEGITHIKETGEVDSEAAREVDGAAREAHLVSEKT